MNRITTRFALHLATAAVVPLLLYGVVSVISLQQGTRSTVIEGNTNVALRAAEHIELHIGNSVKILRAVAADLEHTGLERWQQDRILKNFVLEFPEFAELTLLDEAGAPVVSSRIGRPGVSVPDADGTSFGEVFLSPFTPDDDLLPAAVLGMRLRGAGGTAGWLVGRVSLEELWRAVDRIRIGEHGVALVVTAAGLLLAHGAPEEKSRVARGDNLLDHPLVRELSDAGPDVLTASAEYDGRRDALVGVAARVPALGWTVIVEQPESEAYATTRRLQAQLGAAIGLFLLVTVVAGYYNGRRFITPIFDLIRGTRAVAAGRLDERVTIDATDELGQLGRAFNTMADRLVELQDEVRKKERQATFGRVAIGLVHDISHPIQNIGNSCKLIVKMFDDLEYRRTFQRTVERELTVIKRVLEDLRNVARPIPLEKFPLDVNRALGELIESMQATVEKAGVSLTGELAFGPLYIEGDLFALNRVYRNLIINACQATTPGGAIVIRTRRADGEAVIEVRDTGCGIPAGRLETIFEDFVTTKRQGLGLGLAISKKVVEQLGGTIAVASEVGGGTTFTLRFRLTESRPAQLAAV
ncbi:MAG: HAMP domain-containing protein [Acidimicrobiia bacterium]|nr:HAMP domain-containing protein [Acidimicrobiia bacterium]